jgi:hypothetical protein
MPCKRPFDSNNSLPGWEHFPAKVCEILDRRPENLAVSIEVPPDGVAIVVSVRDTDGHLPNWSKKYPLEDQQSILDDIRREFGV